MKRTRPAAFARLSALVACAHGADVQRLKRSVSGVAALGGAATTAACRNALET